LTDLKGRYMADFSTKNQGTWFYFDEVRPELGGVCLRELSFDQAKAISRETTKTQRRFDGMQWRDDKVVDEDKATDLTYAYCIVDWENVSIDGIPLECTLGNKIKAMKSLDFAKFVLDCLTQLRGKNSAIEVARLKNSETTSNGNSQNQVATTV